MFASLDASNIHPWMDFKKYPIYRRRHRPALYIGLYWTILSLYWIKYILERCLRQLQMRLEKPFATAFWEKKPSSLDCSKEIFPLLNKACLSLAFFRERKSRLIKSFLHVAFNKGFFRLSSRRADVASSRLSRFRNHPADFGISRG